MSVLNNSKFLSRVQTLLDKAEGVKIEIGGECSHLCLNTFARKHCLPSICNQMKFLFAHQLKGENNVLKKYSPVPYSSFADHPELYAQVPAEIPSCEGQ